MPVGLSESSSLAFYRLFISSLFNPTGKLNRRDTNLCITPVCFI